MRNVPIVNEEEIDLIGIIKTIIDGKWKILTFIFISILGLIVITLLSPKTLFIATTEMKPIISAEADKYTLYNSYVRLINNAKVLNTEEASNLTSQENSHKFFEITPKLLFNLFLEQIEEGSIIEEAIEKFKLVEKINYNNQDEYANAVVKLASSMEIHNSKNKNNQSIQKKIIRFKHHNLSKWKEALHYSKMKANISVENIIYNRFIKNLAVVKQEKKFKIEDLDNKIENLVEDYDERTKNQLAFLKEQASIARKLGVKKSTVETQIFSSQNSLIANIKGDTPFYLRGFEAIEEEIRLISDRNGNNKVKFIPGILDLKKQKVALASDKVNERIETLFNKTPINKGDFKAVLMKVASTEGKVESTKVIYYFLVIILAGVVGVIFVLTSNAITKRKDLKQ